MISHDAVELAMTQRRESCKAVNDSDRNYREHNAAC